MHRFRGFYLKTCALFYNRRLIERLKSLDKSSDKSWFSDVVVITSEQSFLNKAKIKYLENIFYEKAKKANRYKLEQTTPTKSKFIKNR